jgi:NDP-sugar pyrophosphorylase family protein
LVSTTPIIDTGVIIAGGKGTRMGDYCENTQKCLLKIRNKPILQYVIESFKICNIGKIYILTGHLHEQIDEFAGKLIDHHLEITTVNTGTIGTARSLSRLKGEIRNPFVYSNGDIIYPISLLRDLLNSYNKLRKRKAELMGIITFSTKNIALTHPHGIIKNGTVKKLIIASKHNPIYLGLCSMELMLLSSDVFHYTDRAERNQMLGSALELAIEEGRKILSYVYKGPWFHLQVPEDFVQADKLSFINEYSR